MKPVIVVLLLLVATSAFVAAAFGAPPRLTNIGLALMSGAGLVEVAPI